MSILLGCTQDEITTATPQQSLFSVPDIGEAKASFTEYNQGINLLSGVKNKTAGRNANAGYTINWGDSKQTTFKENVDILYTPVIKDFVSRKQKSFIASVKNEGKIESVLFTVYYTADFDSTSFTGYISQFTVKGTFLMLYKYTKGVLEKTITPKKEETTRQKRSKEEDCPPITMDYIAEILDMLEESGGGSVTLLGCANLDEDSGSEGGDGGGGSSWNTLNSNIYTPYKNIKTWITPFNGGGAAATSAGGNTNNNNTNDADSSDIDDDAPDDIIDHTDDPCVSSIIKELQQKDLRGALVPDLEGMSHLSQSILDLFGKCKNYDLVIKIENLSKDSNGNLRNAITKGIESITLDKTMVKQATKLSIARTLIHESLHVYINYKINENKRSDFVKKLQTYHIKYNNNNLTQHEFMSQFVEALANSLSVYDFHRQSSSYYKAMSWAGLETSSAYAKLGEKEQKRIQKIIRNERFNKKEAKGSKCN